MMKKKLVSIIVPIYNVENLLEENLKSIIKQNNKEIEIILIDDGSTDESASIYSKYSYLKNLRIIKQKNRGVSAARNAGLKVAKGDYVVFIDPDDIVSTDYINI